MGKSNRLKTEKAENMLTSSTYKKNEKKGLPTWLGTAIIITVLAVVVLLAAFFALNSAGTFNRMRVVMATDHYDVTVPMMSYAIYSEYQELVATYDNYSKQFGVTISIPSGKGGTTLDKNKPLREQIYATQDENGVALEASVTWFDHFAELATESLKKQMVLCEAARADGIKLTKEDKKSIDMAIDTLALYATYYGYTTNGYIVAMYGNGVNKGDVRDMMEIEMLSAKYANQRAEEFVAGVTDEQVQAEYDGNVAKYDVFVDYINYTFTIPFTASTNKDADTAKAENEKNAEKYEAKKATYRAYFKELEDAAKADPANFSKKLVEVLEKYFYDEEKDALLAKKSADATLTAEEEASCLATAKEKAADAALNAVVKNADTSATTMDTKFKTWVTDKNTPRKSGDVYTDIVNRDAFGADVTSKENADGEETKDDGPVDKDYTDTSATYAIYVLNSGLKRNDGKLRSVAHILFKTESYANLTKTDDLSAERKILADRVMEKHGKVTAELMANELLELMVEENNLKKKTDENGNVYYEMDEAIFEAYGKQYTEDSNVIYDNVKQGQMVKNFENWMFDPARKLGEVSYPAAVETDYGYHVMLYRGDEKDAWSYTIRVSLAEGRYDA
jgi:hypothetical protein